ncbi:MAG: glycine cleavage system protein H [Candidatus Lindowbacteria bacterium RIFCSPLOWO2_12_FULL_62_27]|nr:MAG: glycine cleavage system protein H [Candidatus Lindowbacteria bacterium RIFCSPLOWO2_12_FULL_62_27]OGH56753.1 MAG: glycine cleavage system protein H [Candidatus Lindowbacteria bacterium RIFCSPLOWO2_02_FULL_62_12]
MGAPADLKFTKEHEWLRLTGSVGVVGITQFAADQLGDVVYVDLPAPGKEAKQSDVLASIESVKAVSDIYAPVSGKVTRVNADLAATPELVNSDPYGRGWMMEIEVKSPSDASSLLSPQEYEKHINSGK